MSRMSFVLPMFLLSAMLLAAVSIAQERKVSAREFPAAVIESPADPDPTTQSVAERTETLRKRMREAKSLLEAGKTEECFMKYIDPFWLARAAASSGSTIDELFKKQINSGSAGAKEISARFGKTLDASLTLEPEWLLNGRAASFITNRSSHTAEFWIYFDGKWRISPET